MSGCCQVRFYPLFLLPDKQLRTLRIFLTGFVLLLICQAAVPMGFDEKCPVSVSFIARHGGDRFLLDTVQTMYAVLQEEADLAAKVKPSKNVVSQETSAEMAKEKVGRPYIK